MLVEVLCFAVGNGNEALLDEYSGHLDFAIGLLEGGVPDWLFQALLALIQKPKFLQLEHVCNLLLVFDLNWPSFSELQQQKVLTTLEATYPAFSAWQSCIGITEFLGSSLSDERAFRALCRLKKVEAEMPRSFIPHGLEHIAKDCPDKNVARQALDELMQMRADPSQQVRAKVEESLARLAKHSIIPS